MDLHVNGVRLHVRVAGTGPAVLLLHGFPDSSAIWAAQTEALVAAGHRVIAPDLRGFGASDRPSGVAAYAVGELLGDTVGVLDALEVDVSDVVGHDWGAALAWQLAMRHPVRVRSLTAVSVGHPMANRAAGLRQRQLSWYMLWFLLPGVAESVLPADDWSFFRQWAWSGADPDDPHLARQVADLSRPGALLAGLNLYRANTDPAAFVRGPAPDSPRHRVACPVMGVWSSDDFALGEEQMSGSAAYVDGPWRYERIEAVDHWVPTHAADRLSELLVGFLAR